jgi:hypothetical protein
MPILQPPRNEPQRPILLRISFFFYLFSFGFVFSEKSKATYLLFFYFIFWICFFGFFSPSLKLTKMKKKNIKKEMGRKI